MAHSIPIQHVEFLNTGLTTSPDQESHLPAVEPAVTGTWHHRLRIWHRGIPSMEVSLAKGRNFETHREYFNQPAVFFSTAHLKRWFPGESGEKKCILMHFMVPRCWKKNIMYTIRFFRIPVLFGETSMFIST